MTVYISVISHEHSELINELSCLSTLSHHFKVVIKSNRPNDSFDELNKSPKFYWINEQYGCGFGHNNNIVFKYCKSELAMSDNDTFIVLNPDVVISVDEIELLVNDMRLNKVKLSAINLYKDIERTIYDNSIRKFPSLFQFIKSFIGLGNSSLVDKDILTLPSSVDWAAGSFLAFEAGHYAALNGFDENYFMYCEDIDICYRSYLKGHQVIYYPNIKALHLTKHANRKLFSKHFYWHVTSVIRFLFTRAGLTKSKSHISSLGSRG